MCHTASFRAKPDDVPTIYPAAASHQTGEQEYLRFLIACASDPRFTADTILGEIAKNTRLSLLGLDLPFIIVSGTIGEETAVSAMRAGDQARRLFIVPPASALATGGNVYNEALLSGLAARAEPFVRADLNPPLIHGLTEAAERLVGVLRPDDIVARLGGDEFVVLLDGLDDLREPVSLAQRIHRALKEPVMVDGWRAFDVTKPAARQWWLYGADGKATCNPDRDERSHAAA